MDPVIWFFALGVFAGLARSDLRMPPAIYDLLSMLLLLAIGLKGGVELARAPSAGILPQALAVIAMGFTLPLFVYPIARKLGRFERADAASLAAHSGSVSVAPFAVGVTEDPRINSQILVGEDGEILGSYVKVRRVPYGEYVPLRGLLEALGAPVGQVGRDAIKGTEPAILDLPDGTRLGVVISWEVFFAGRAREGVKLGADSIVNPTNGASYTGTIVQTQQVASSRLRAIENGRWVVQAAPTGFTAIVDSDGEVLQRTAVSEQRVLYDTIELRTGRTWYTDLGDGPVIAALVVLLGLSIALSRRRRAAA